MNRNIWLTAIVLAAVVFALAIPRASSQGGEIGIAAVWPRVLKSDGVVCIYGIGLLQGALFVGNQRLNSGSGACPANAAPKDEGMVYEKFVGRLAPNQLALLPAGRYHTVKLLKGDSSYGYLVANRLGIFRFPVVMSSVRVDDLREKGSRRRSIIEGQVLVAIDPAHATLNDGSTKALDAVLKNLNFDTSIATTLKIGNLGKPIVQLGGLCGQVFAVLKANAGNSTEDVLNEVTRVQQSSQQARNTIFGADPVPHYLGPSNDSIPGTPTTKAKVQPTTSYKGVNVAVLDTGYSTISSLTSVITNLSPVFTSNDFETDPYGPQATSSLTDEAGHGTTVAAIIAANRSGIIPGAGIVPIKACRKDKTCTGMPVISGICHVINLARSSNVRVLNASISSLVDNSFVVAALGEVAAAGVTTVVSAGNRRCNLSDPSKNLISFPALHANDTQGMIAVSAVNTYSSQTASASAQLNSTSITPAPFSSCGDWVSVSAPGVKVLGRFSGTSFSAPFVSGIAARLWNGERYNDGSPNPLSLEEVKWAIMKNARPFHYVSKNPKLYGAGFVQLPTK